MLFKTNSFKLSAVAGVVSDKAIPVDEYCCGYASEKKIKRTIKETGFKRISIIEEGITTSDMCYQAAEVLIKNYGIDKRNIGGLIFISQTPDYIAPSTAFVLQKRLNLSNDIIAFDVNLGCPGFVYGLYLGSMILSSLSDEKSVLVCCGDVASSYFANSEVFAARAITADAGSCILLERDSTHKGDVWFNIDSYGDKFNALYVPNGGMRHPRTTIDGIVDKNNPKNFSVMDGLSVLDFTLNEVPNNIEELITYLGIKKEELDLCFFHQPNYQLVKALQEKLYLNDDKVVFNSCNIGNASSASIPLLMTEMSNDWSNIKRKKVLISGFGMGMAVGTVILNLDSTICIKTIKYKR